MTANELRIGNFLYNDKVVVKIDARTIFDIWDDKGLKNYKPIPITEKWLLNIGFKCDDINNTIRTHFEHLSDYRFEYYIEKINKYHLRGFYFMGNSIGTIKYIHQLQNIYFALTQKELEL